MKGKTYIFLLVGMLVVFLCGCGGEKNEHFELENTPWGMSLEETMQVYDAKKDEVKYLSESQYGSVFILADGREIFGAKTEQIVFNFLDMTVSDQTHKLCDITVMYPEDTEMSEVVKNMKRSFGKPSQTVTDFDKWSSLMDDDMRRYDYEADEHLTLWSDQKISDVIPKDKAEEYEKLWEIPMTRLSADKWEEFSENSSLVYVFCSDNAQNAPKVAGLKGFNINAVNWVTYTTISEQLEQ